MSRTSHLGIVNIPVKIPVAKFIQREWGDFPLEIHHRMVAGQLIIHFDADPVPWDPDPEAIRITEVPVQIHVQEVLHRYQSLNKARKLGTMFWSIFATSMFTWIEAQQAAGVTAWDALTNFLDLYDIREEDYALESAYRYWLKYRRHTGPTQKTA